MSGPVIDLRRGDCLKVMKSLPDGCVDAVVTDPPYGLNWNTDSTRFSGGRAVNHRKGGDGRADYVATAGDDRPFDPSPWLSYPKVILWGSNHYAARLPVGTTLVWLKKGEHLYGTFLSDAEIGWMKGGHGVYCHHKNFPPPVRMYEAGVTGQCVHPNQKPVGLMRWCIERLKLKPGSTILDPYMGTGTTGVAAVQLGMSFIGIEQNPGYFTIARRRIKAATPLLSAALA